jgi:hypothetical protein
MEKHERQADQFLRLFAEGETGAWRSGPLQALGRIRALTERYHEAPSESRYQAEGGGEITGRVARASTIWASARLEGRAYPDSTERNYGRGQVSLGTSVPLRGGRLSLGTTLGGIDYRRTGSFDRRHEILSAEVGTGAGRRVELRLLTHLEWSRYARSAIKRIGPDQFDLSGRQRDHAREIEIGASFHGAWLIEGGLSWQSVRSNSFGYSVGRKRVGAAISGWLPGEVLFQVRGQLEAVSYHDPGLDRVFIIRTGEDQEAGEDNNFGILRLRRAVYERIALDARYSFYRNESLLVGKFYRKSVVSLGLEWRPFGPSDF